MEKNQPFCNTTEVIAKLDSIWENYQRHEWRGCNMAADDFIALQDMVTPEREYLKDFWTEHDCINLKKFYRWNCERAYYDLPINSQDYAGNRGKYKKYYSLGFDKYNVFHERERHLEDVQHRIFSMFHDWQFCTQGFTAY